MPVLYWTHRPAVKSKAQMGGWPVQGCGTMGRRHTAGRTQSKRKENRQQSDALSVAWLSHFTNVDVPLFPHPRSGISADIPSRSQSCSGFPNSLRIWRSDSSWRRNCSRNARGIQNMVQFQELQHRPLRNTDKYFVSTVDHSSQSGVSGCTPAAVTYQFHWKKVCCRQILPHRQIRVSGLVSYSSVKIQIDQAESKSLNETLQTQT